MIRDGLAGFNVAVFAGQLYRDELAANGRRHYADAARIAFQQAAAFLRVAKRHDLTTAEPNGLPMDDPADQGDGADDFGVAVEF